MSNSKLKRIVLVNLGPKVPSYLYDNLKWLRLNFPDYPILVIIDNESIQELLMDWKVEAFLYKRKKEIDILLAKLEHDISFRDGFWNLTIDRLFALCDAVIELDLEQTVYIESDVLLLPSFPIHELQKLEKLAWTRYNQVRDVPSIVVIPTTALAKQMRADLMARFHANTKLTDMSALNELATNRNELVSLLPTIVEGLENQILVDVIEFKRITELLPDFTSKHRGIFDGAIIGMYLTGQDPHNSYGFTFFLNQTLLNENENYVDLKKCEFSFQNRKLFLVTQKREKVEIFNLHIHSKNPELFTEKIFEHLEIMVGKANQRIPYTKFDSKILYKLISDNFRNRTLLRYLRKLLYFAVERLKSRFNRHSIAKD